MCGGGGGGGSGSGESLELQRKSLNLSKQQFKESKRQWGEQFQWQRDRAKEQKRIANARAGKGPVRTTEYAMSALEGREHKGRLAGFGKDRLKNEVRNQGTGLRKR